MTGKINEFDTAVPLSPTSFNICMNQIITEWKEEKINEINFLRYGDIEKL